MKKSLFPVFLPYKCKGKSQTVPNQAFTVSDILAKFAVGMSMDLIRDDELGEDYDEDIDTPLDRTRDPDFGLDEARDYLNEFNEKMARYDLDNNVPDDTTKKNNEKIEENLP